MRTLLVAFFRLIKQHQRFLRICLLLCIIVNLGSTLYMQRVQYTSFTYWQNFPHLKTIYDNSQYVNKHPKGSVPDEFVNAYAGGAYITGTSPVLIAADTPPLGRYLIGLSAVLFNNANLIILFFGGLSLVMMYVVGKQIYKNSLVALLPISFLSFEQIFKNQFVYVPLLDIIQLGFLLLCFYFFNKGFLQKQHALRYFLFTNFFLGCFIATKFFATGLTVTVAFVVVLLLHKKFKLIMQILVTSFLSVVVLLATYLNVFAFKAYTFSSFLGIQKYVFLYHKSQLILPFSIWPLMLLNKWYVWWGTQPILSDPQWRISWPLITIFSFITIGLYLLKKIPHRFEVEVCMAWIVGYFGFFSFGQISARYFVILIPILYLVTIYGIQSLVLEKIKQFNTKK